MHHSFIAVETTLIADATKTGGSFIFPIATMSNVAQGGAAIAAFFIINKIRVKSVASAAVFQHYLVLQNRLCLVLT